MLLTGLFLAGLFVLLWKYRRPPLIFAYVFGVTMIYAITLSIREGNYFYLLPLASFLLFYLVWRWEKRTIWIGILFDGFLASFFLYLIYMRIFTEYLFFHILAIFGLFLFAAVILMGYFGLVAFLLANFAIVRKRESRSFANRLTLLLGLGILFLQILQGISHIRGVPVILGSLVEVANGVVGYFFLQFAFYLTASILYNLNPVRTFKKYVVICGAGLMDGRKVTPLLHNRIKAGTDFANSQALLTGKYPTVIMSGGKGSDERVSEAFAMREDAIQSGFPEQHILMENESTTTYENLKYCKALIQERENKLVPIAFSTNNFHLFRTALFAKNLGLDAEGIGAKTARYYLPNAFLREFFAYLVMTKWWHLSILLTLFIYYLSNLVINYYYP